MFPVRPGGGPLEEEGRGRSYGLGLAGGKEGPGGGLSWAGAPGLPSVSRSSSPPGGGRGPAPPGNLALDVASGCAASKELPVHELCDSWVPPGVGPGISRRLGRVILKALKMFCTFGLLATSFHAMFLLTMSQILGLSTSPVMGAMAPVLAWPTIARKSPRASTHLTN